jgi:hypothetical protein
MKEKVMFKKMKIFYGFFENTLINYRRNILGNQRRK